MTTPDQTRSAVSIDAINHVVEAATTTVTNPLAISLAAETIRLVHQWLPAVLSNPADLKADVTSCAMRPCRLAWPLTTACCTLRTHLNTR